MPTRKQERREIVNFLYHHFLMKYSVKNTANFFQKKKQFTAWQNNVLNFAFSHWTKLIDLLTKHISDKWQFDALSNLEKSILVIATSEFFAKITPREIAITEAVKQAQEFGGTDSYVYINRVLDTVFDFKMTK